MDPSRAAWDMAEIPRVAFFGFKALRIFAFMSNGTLGETESLLYADRATAG